MSTTPTETIDLNTCDYDSLKQIEQDLRMALSNTQLQITLLTGQLMMVLDKLERTAPTGQDTMPIAGESSRNAS